MHSFFFSALRFSHQICPLSHSGGVIELAGSPISLISFWIHLALRLNKAFLFCRFSKCWTYYRQDWATWASINCKKKRRGARWKESFGERMTCKSRSKLFRWGVLETPEMNAGLKSHREPARPVGGFLGFQSGLPEPWSPKEWAPVFIITPCTVKKQWWKTKIKWQL